MEMLTISDGNCKEKSICLSSRDTCNEMARDYLQTKVALQNEQQQSIQDSCKEVTGGTPLILENSESMDLLPKHSCVNRQTCLNVETKNQMSSDNLETRRSIQDTQNRSVRGCHGVINCDKILHLENFETMDVLPNHGDDCLTNMTFAGNDRHFASTHLETEMPLEEKQSPSIQSRCEVIHSDIMLIREKSDDMFPKINADCGKKKRVSFNEAYSNVEVSSLETYVSLQEPCQMAPSCCKIYNADQILALENPVTLDIPSNCEGECGKNSLSLGKGQHEGIQSCGELICNTMLDRDNSMPIDTVESIHDDSGKNSNSILTRASSGFDCMEEARQLVRNCCEASSAAVPESSAPLVSFSKCYGDSSIKKSLLDETSESVSPDHHETGMLPQGEHHHSCCGDTSSALEHSVTMDTSTGTRSKSGVSLSADRMVTVLGTNSKSRTSFFNSSSGECGENFGASASSSENVQQKARSPTDQLSLQR
ncbi:hypothetical protein ABZP36_020964 [Zizania latifolia]